MLKVTVQSPTAASGADQHQQKRYAKKALTYSLRQFITVALGGVALVGLFADKPKVLLFAVLLIGTRAALDVARVAYTAGIIARSCAD